MKFIEDFIRCSPEESRPAAIERRYSGLFEYHIPTNTWKKRKDDAGGTLRFELHSFILIHGQITV